MMRKSSIEEFLFDVESESLFISRTENLPKKEYHSDGVENIVGEVGLAEADNAVKMDEKKAQSNIYERKYDFCGDECLGHCLGDHQEGEEPAADLEEVAQ